MAILWIVAFDEVGEVFGFEGVLFEGVVDIGAVVVKPDLFSPGILAGGLAVEEDIIGFVTPCALKMTAGRRRIV